MRWSDVLALIPVLRGGSSPSYVTESPAPWLEGVLVKQLLKSTDTTTVFVFSYRIFLVNNRLSHFVVFFCRCCSESRVRTREVDEVLTRLPSGDRHFDRHHLIFLEAPANLVVPPPPTHPLLVLNNVSSHWFSFISYFVLQLFITWFECK